MAAKTTKHTLRDIYSQAIHGVLGKGPHNTHPSMASMLGMDKDEGGGLLNWRGLLNKKLSAEEMTQRIINRAERDAGFMMGVVAGAMSGPAMGSWTYSKLGRAIAKIQKSGTKQMKRGSLLAKFRDAGVNQKELQWTGVGKLLEGNPVEKVSLADIQKTFKQGEIRLETVESKKWSSSTQPHGPGENYKASLLQLQPQGEQREIPKVVLDDAGWYPEDDLDTFLSEVGVFVDRSDAAMSAADMIDTRASNADQRQEELNLVRIGDLRSEQANQVRQALTYQSGRPIAGIPNLEDYYVVTDKATSSGGHGFSDTIHWDDVEDVVSWPRMGDFKALSGEKVKHLHEVQSKWASQLQKIKAKEAKLEQKEVELSKQEKIDDLTWKALNRSPRLQMPIKAFQAVQNRQADWFDRFMRDDRTLELVSDVNVLKNELESDRVRTPDMPYKGLEAEKLALKRFLHEAAADPDVKGISWTTGQQQADRWNLSHHFKKLRLQKQISGNWNIYGVPVEPNAAEAHAGVEPDERIFAADIHASELVDYFPKKILEQVEETAKGPKAPWPSASGLFPDALAENLNAVNWEMSPNLPEKAPKEIVLEGDDLDASAKWPFQMYDEFAKGFFEKEIKKAGGGKKKAFIGQHGIPNDLQERNIEDLSKLLKYKQALFDGLSDVSTDTAEKQRVRLREDIEEISQELKWEQERREIEPGEDAWMLEFPEKAKENIKEKGFPISLFRQLLEESIV